MSMNIIEKIEDGKRVIEQKVQQFPKIVVALGSGFSSLLDGVDLETSLLCSDIPHMRALTVEGHNGRLLVGTLSGTRIACLQGRLHYYEGYSMEDVVYPFRLLGWMGAEIFLLTNASGALSKDMCPPELLLIRDHINMMGSSPLIGKNEDRLGPRFPDLTDLYDRELGNILLTTAKRLNTPIREGIYVGLHGPAYETASEVKMYRMLGADVAGMSTVPEAIALHHMGKRVLGLSCVTNLAAGVEQGFTTHSEVLENVKKIQPVITKLISAVISEIGRKY